MTDKNKNSHAKKKFMPFDDWKKQNQQYTSKPINNPVVSKSIRPALQPEAVLQTNQSVAPNTDTRTWDKFHNPYHFVPAKNGGRIDDLCKTTFENRQLGHVTHDRYVDNTHSGRVICRLTTKTPFFVGDKRTKDGNDRSPAEVSPFQIDDKPAIPAASLRGLISNIAEAASNSALRVLEEQIYLARINGIKTKIGTTYAYFSSITPELLPFNPDRKSISIAEQMFGFVEQDYNKDKADDPKEKKKQAFALASRLRFSNAIWANDKDTDYYLEEVVLKILDSPKPPSPALYFKKKDGHGAYISKQQLSTNSHHPQGRKYYLHRVVEEKESWVTNPPWKTANENKRPQQKVKITPVKDGAVFYFHINFDNLSNLELGLLLYSLNPSDTFQHKLGMGKPIGLGSVKIEPVGLFTVNRKERYFSQTGDLFEQKRYHNAWKSGTNSLPAIYDREKMEYGDGNQLGKLDYEKIKKGFADRMDKDIQKALEILGDPAKVTIPVHYPQLTNKDIENENFKWFMNNDDRNNHCKQFLKPLELTELK